MCTYTHKNTCTYTRVCTHMRRHSCTYTHISKTKVHTFKIHVLKLWHISTRLQTVFYISITNDKPTSAVRRNRDTCSLFHYTLFHRCVVVMQNMRHGERECCSTVVTTSKIIYCTQLVHDTVAEKSLLQPQVWQQMGEYGVCKSSGHSCTWSWYMRAVFPTVNP